MAGLTWPLKTAVLNMVSHGPPAWLKMLLYAVVAGATPWARALRAGTSSGLAFSKAGVRASERTGV